MVARNFTARLKPNCLAEFSSVFEHRIIPLLRKQKGFQDEIKFIAPGKLEATSISLWDQHESAEAYGHRIYPEVLKVLADIVDGIPQIRTFHVSNSTFLKIAVPVAACGERPFQ